MPSTTPDFSTSTAGCSVGRATAPLASLKVGGVRGARCGGTSPDFGLSDLGQASSNDARGGSAGSGGTAGGQGRRPAAKRAVGNRSLMRARGRRPLLRRREEKSRKRP